MKSNFLLFFLLSLVLACSPRDDLSPSGSAGVLNLKSGEKVQVTQLGEKLPSCINKDGSPSSEVHGQARLFPEVSFLFDKYKDLKLLVSKGDFNCNQISNDTPVTLAIKRTQDGKFEVTDTQFFISKLELYNTKDFLENPKFEKNLKEAASGMLMSVEQMREFLLSAPQKENITIAYFGDSLKADPVGDEIKATVQYFSVPEYEGKTVSTCTKTWTDIQIFADQKPLFLDSIKGKKIKAMISGGNMNCYSLGAVIPFKIKNEDKTFEQIPDSEVKVLSVALLNQMDFLTNPLLTFYVADEMNMTIDDFLLFLKGLNKDQIHLTRFSWQ